MCVYVVCVFCVCCVCVCVVCVLYVRVCCVCCACVVCVVCVCVCVGIEDAAESWAISSAPPEDAARSCQCGLSLKG